MSESRPYSDGRGKLERFLEDHSGWGRLLITIVFLALQAAWFTRGLQDQAEAQFKTATELQKQLSSLDNSVRDLSGQVTRLALSNERVSVQLLENKEHINDTARRVEKLEDGRHNR